MQHRCRGRPPLLMLPCTLLRHDGTPQRQPPRWPLLHPTDCWSPHRLQRLSRGGGVQGRRHRRGDLRRDVVGRLPGIDDAPGVIPQRLKLNLHLQRIMAPHTSPCIKLKASENGAVQCICEPASRILVVISNPCLGARFAGNAA